MSLNPPAGRAAATRALDLLLPPSCLSCDHPVGADRTLCPACWGRIHTARALASWMHRAAAEFWGEADLIMPVPLHRWRLFKRRYNQAALLAYNLAALGHKRYAPDTLVHHRATPSQGHLARKDRQKNVKGAFGLNPRYRDHMRARNVILVDDVLTTGSIMDECARLLLDSGAKTVNALVLARVRGYL